MAIAFTFTVTSGSFQRGEFVRVLSDPSPAPTYVVMSVDHEDRSAVLAQVGTRFVRRVPVEQLRPTFSWDSVPQSMEPS